jgi:uncharacterized membrane protein (UPF0127 family)
MRLIDETTGKILANRVELADNFWRRFRGLMFRRRFPRGNALLFRVPKPGRYGIHMFFVRFPIDLLYLDSRFVVVELREGLRPWSTHRPKTIANYLIELPAGTISRLNVKVGHKITLQ